MCLMPCPLHQLFFFDKYTMDTAKLRASTFSAFYSISTVLPDEIVSLIINYVIAESQPIPLGGDVVERPTYHPNPSCYAFGDRYTSIVFAQHLGTANH